MINYDFTQMPIVDIVNQMIILAVKSRASDIHLDPRENGLLVRLRIDGTLRDHTIVPLEYEKNLVTRVKLLANMNITETRLPQDGAIKGKIEGIDVDMRVSSLPTNEGEKVVIRILDYSMSLEGIEELGFTEDNYKKLLEMISVPNGIILVTGATGTGKSTTVYAMLQRLNKEDTNIISVEDPVEMNIEGINQVQTNSEIGLDFATVLRSILRQDPNVIMIGEIRDTETAKIAVRASITGHLVLSTIHTNDALNTIERLLDMDVERYLLASALEGIIAQKLARKLCDKCKKKREASTYEKELFKKALNKDVEYLYSAEGCEECHHGYKGRVPIHEVLLINTLIRDAITENMRKDELRHLVYSQDVTSLLQDGLEKVEAGLTTVEELLKLIDLENSETSKETTIGLKESLRLAEEREHELIKKEREEEKKKSESLKEKAPASKNKKEESEEDLLEALKSLNIDFPVNPDSKSNEDDDELLDRTGEIEDILSGLDLNESDGLTEDELREILK